MGLNASLGQADSCPVGRDQEAICAGDDLLDVRRWQVVRQGSLLHDDRRKVASQGLLQGLAPEHIGTDRVHQIRLEGTHGLVQSAAPLAISGDPVDGCAAIGRDPLRRGQDLNRMPAIDEMIGGLTNRESAIIPIGQEGIADEADPEWFHVL